MQMIAKPVLLIRLDLRPAIARHEPKDLRDDRAAPLDGLRLED